MVDIDLNLGGISVGIGLGLGGSGSGSTTSPTTPTQPVQPPTDDEPSVLPIGRRCPIVGACFSCRHAPTDHSKAGCSHLIAGAAQCPCRRHMREVPRG